MSFFVGGEYVNIYFYIIKILFFKEPVEVMKGQIIKIHFWRCVSKKKVWYEWCLTSPSTTHIHNLGGRSCHIYCT